MEDAGVGGGGLVPFPVVVVGGGAGDSSRLRLNPPSPIELRLRARKEEAERRGRGPFSSWVTGVGVPVAAAIARDFLSIVLSRALRLGLRDLDREDLEKEG